MKRIGYGKIFQISKYLNERLYLDDEFDETVSDISAIIQLKERIVNMKASLDLIATEENEQEDLKRTINLIKHQIAETKIIIETSQEDLTDFQSELNNLLAIRTEQADPINIKIKIKEELKKPKLTIKEV